MTYWYIRQKPYGAVRVYRSGGADAWKAGVTRVFRTNFESRTEAMVALERLLFGRNSDFRRTFAIVKVTTRRGA